VFTSKVPGCMAAAADAEEPVAGIGGASVPYGDNTLPDEDVEASAETALETTLRLPSEAMSTTLRSPPPADAQPIELTPSQAGVAQEVELDQPLKIETAPLEPQELFGQSGQLVHEDSRPSRRVADEAPGIAPAVVKGCMEKLGVVNEYYSKMVVKRPCIMVVVYLIALAVLIGAAWRPFELETDFSAFIKADGRSQREREAYLQALEDKSGYTARRRLQEERAQRAEAGKAATENLPHRRLSRECNRTSSVLPQEDDDVDVVIESWPNMDEALQAIDDDGQLFIESPKTEAGSADVKVAGRRLQGTVYTKKELTILYIAKDGNALDERVLRVQRDLEQRLLSLQGWRNFCIERGNQALQFRCNPGESLVAYAWPSETEVSDTRHTHSYTFDGGGRDLLPQPALLALMKQSSSDGLDPLRYFTKEFEIPDVGSSEEVPAVQGLRTKYVFTISVSRETDAGRVIDLTSVNADYENFIIDEVYPVLSDSSLDEEPAHIYYEGDVITGYEIEKTLMEDLMWAIGSITFVLVYMWAHTKRFYLSICALLIIFAAVPVGYVLTPVAKTTIASFLSVFLITGVGSDVVFVFTDFWDQSKMVHRKPSELHLRVAFMISHAGKSCLATSLTTAVSFFANLASALQPLREFGLFMGLCVMGAYALVLLLLPPLIVLRCRSSQPQVRPDDNASRGYYGSDPHGGQVAEPGELDEDDSPRPGRPVIQFMLFNLMGFLGRGRNAAIVVAVTSISCIAFTIGTALEAELDQGVPEIFPEDHNQVQVDEWTSSFQTVTDLTSSPMRTGTVCAANSTAEVLDSTCLFYWCEAGVSEPDYDISTSLQGACYHSPNIAATQWANSSFEMLSLDGIDVQACHTIDWDIHVASSEPPAASMWPRRFSEYVDSYLDNNFTTTASSTVSELKAIGIENWELGKVDMTRFFRIGAAASTAKSIPPDAFVGCTIQTMCYFGSSACEWNNPWHFMGPISLEETTVTSTPAAAARRLTDSDAAESPLFGLVTATVPANKRIDITVVWGLLPPLSTPLVGELEAPWKFDSSFQPQNPWSQRAMASMCDHSSLPIGLRVVESKCWLDRFKQDLLNRGDRFPTRNFDEELERWFPSTIEAAANIWIVDGVMAANKLTFYVDVNDEKNSDALIEYKELWDAYVSDLNAKAGVTANHAFHTAEAWVRAEAEVAIVGSTVETIIIASACAWLGVLIFTGDPVLALIVLGLVLGIISGLAFFMVCVMRWKIGPVEVISLVVFVGYSVTYSLHIAHNYAEVKEESLELMILEGEARKREEERRLRKGRPGTAMSEGSLNVAEQDAPAALEATPHTPTAAITAATDNSPMPRGTSPGGDSFLRHDATHDSQHQPFAQTGTSFTSTGAQRRFSLTLRSLRQLSVSEEDNALIGVPRFQLTKAELRRARTRVAVLHVGGATLSSSLSTFGCSCFLLFCTLTIFDKLGAVVIAVTTLSIVFAVVALPAALMLVGPSRDPWYRRAIRQRLATSMQRCKGQPGGQDAPPPSILPLPEVTPAPPPSFPPDSGEAPDGEEPDL